MCRKVCMMLAIGFLALVVLGLSAVSEAQYWAKTYGRNLDEQAYCVREDPAGNYVVVGYSNSLWSGPDILVTKLDNYGQVEWAKFYDQCSDPLDATIFDEYGYSIVAVQLPFSPFPIEYVVAGCKSEGPFGGKDILIMKLDEDGNVIWARAYGWAGDECARCIKAVPLLGGYRYIVTGYTNSFGSADFLVMQLDGDGDPINAKVYDNLSTGFSAADSAHCIDVVSIWPDSFVVAGVTTPGIFGGVDALVIKLNSDLNPVWAREYGLNFDDYVYSIRRTPSGGSIVAGKSNSPSGGANYDMLVMNLASDGSELWARAYDNAMFPDAAKSIDTISPGGYIVAGYTHYHGITGDLDLLLTNLTNTGDVNWAKVLYPSPPYPLLTDNDLGYSAQTIDNGYAVAGYTNSYGAGQNDFLVAITDQNGVIIPPDTCLKPCSLSITFTETLFWHDAKITVIDSIPPWDSIPICIDSMVVDSTINERRRPTFIAHFMTPEGEPYPFDVIISDGEWVQKFDSVTYIETEVPDTATYTTLYRWVDEEGTVYRSTFTHIIPFEPDDIRSFEFFAYPPETLVELASLYVSSREIGANESLSWSWDPSNMMLDFTVSKEPNKYVSIFGILDENLDEMPNHGVDSTTLGIDIRFCKSEKHYPDTTREYDWHFHIHLFSPSSGFIRFGDIDPSEGALGIYGLFYNHAEIKNFTTTLYSVETGDKINPKFIYPQYAAPRGYYLLRIGPKPPPELDDFPDLYLPILLEAGQAQTMNVYPLKKDAIQPFTFSVIAENPFAHSSYSNLFHAPGDSITVDVSTETEYDYWGCFVLPDTLTVAAARAYDGVVWSVLHEFYDYTINPVDAYNLVTVRIPPEMDGLECTYTSVGVQEAEANLPKTFAVYQNFPNPFASSTEIKYALPKDSHVKLEIYNVVGQKVATLIDVEQQAGYHTIHWNGRDDKGRKVASGVYSCKIKAGGYIETRKLTLVR